MPSILVDYSTNQIETDRLLDLCRTIGSLQAVHQKLVVEIVLLRMFSLFENAVASISIKLVCGASYVDGTAPNLLIRANSAISAHNLLKTHGRTRQRSLSWSKSSEIKDNLRYVMDRNDNIVQVIDRYGHIIDEIRRVRNRIAHNNSNSRKHFREVVRRHYGGYLNHITPGVILLSPRITPKLIETYIRQQRIIIKDLVRV